VSDELTAELGDSIVAKPTEGSTVRGVVIDVGESPTRGKMQYTVTPDDGSARVVCVFAGELCEVTKPNLTTFIVTQTEQYRVRATDSEAAKLAVASGDEDDPNVEWLQTVASTAEAM
jgi:hypothetical protein